MAEAKSSRLLVGLRRCLCSVLALAVLAVAVVLGLREKAILRHGRDIRVPATLRGTNALVTGSSSGIGFSTAVRLCRRGAHVIVHGPDEGRTKRAAAEVLVRCGGKGHTTPLAADLSNFTAVVGLANVVKVWFRQVHLLVLNAGFNYGAAPIFGAWAKKRMEALPESFFADGRGNDHVMSANHFGHFLLTLLLMPNLSPQARVVVVTGNGMWQGDWRRLVPLRRVRWERLRAQAYLAYEDSKLANVCFGRELRSRLGASRTVIVHDPGQIRTSMLVDRRSKAYLERYYLRAPASKNWVWWYMSADEAAERLIAAAYVVRRPVPDVVYSYWFPTEIFRHLRHHGHVVQRNRWRQRLPVKFLMHQFWTFGPLYDGIGPSCGDTLFMNYHWNYSLNATGLGFLADSQAMNSFRDYFLTAVLTAKWP